MIQIKSLRRPLSGPSGQCDTPSDPPQLKVTDDRTINLYLIEQAIRKAPNANAKTIAKMVANDSGYTISATDCQQLINRYQFHYNKRYLISFFLTILIVLAVYGQFAVSGWQHIWMLFIVPLTYYLIDESWRTIDMLRFRPQSLQPRGMKVSAENPPVSIIIPSRNEPFEVAKMTFDSAMALEYGHGKKQIIVVDNSATDFADYGKWRDYVSSHANGQANNMDGVEVKFIHRDGVEGFKPRNLDMALDAVNGDYILYLDVDSTLEKDTLLKAIAAFGFDQKLGFVQFYTVPTNTYSSATMSLANGINGYFQRLGLVLSMHGSSSLFYGHNAIWRTEVVRSLGECLEYHNDEVVVAEDLSMSLRGIVNGYHGRSLWLQSGEWVPTSMCETEAMWTRWTMGTFQVFSKHFKALRQQKPFNRFELFGWLNHVGCFVSAALMPVIMVLALLSEFGPLLMLISLSFIPYMIKTCGAALKLNLRGEGLLSKLKHCYHAFFVSQAFVMWVQFAGFYSYFSGKKLGWKPTGKAHEDEVPWQIIIKQRAGLLLFSVVVLALIGNIIVTGGMDNLWMLAGAGLFACNLIACVVLFGKSRMVDSTADSVIGSQIQDVDGFINRN